MDAGDGAGDITAPSVAEAQDVGPDDSWVTRGWGLQLDGGAWKLSARVLRLGDGERDMSCRRRAGGGTQRPLWSAQTQPMRRQKLRQPRLRR